MTDEINGCLDAISFYTQLSQIKPFEDVLSYRLLKAKKGMLLKSSEVSKYSSIYPDCHKYIFTCPYYNKKIKFKDKEKFEYIGVVENYESKVDSDNGKCGEIYVGVEKSNNPKIKNGKAWVFLEDQITEIEEIN